MSYMSLQDLLAAQQGALIDSNNNNIADVLSNNLNSIDTDLQSLDGKFEDSNNDNITEVIKAGLSAIAGALGETAEDVTYDNTNSGMAATNVQDAIDEIDTTIKAMDYSDTAVSGSYVTEVDETDGKIAVTRESADATPTDSSLKMVTSGGVKTALDAKADITSIAPNESGNATASQAYVTGQYFYKDGYFCEVIANIASGATLTENSNYTVRDIADVLKYKVGDSITFSNEQHFAIVSYARERVFATISLAKPLMSDVSGVSFDNSTTIYVRIATGGNIVANEAISNYTNYIANNGNTLQLVLYKTGSTFDVPTNNCIVALEIRGTMTFT